MLSSWFLTSCWLGMLGCDCGRLLSREHAQAERSQEEVGNRNSKSHGGKSK